MASERINISSPSISTAISHLERELDVQLFIRHHAKGLSLTPAGRVLLREAKRVLEQAEHLYAAASEATDQVRGQLTVGCFITLAPMIMSELARSFTDLYPATRIIQVQNDQEALLRSLHHAEIDVAITYDLQIPADIRFTALAQLPVHVVLSETHPLAKKSAVRLSELVNQPLILLDLPISREYFLALFLNAGLEPTIGMRSAHQEVVRTMVANNYGYTLANVRPRSSLALDGRSVVRVPLIGNHRPMAIGIAVLSQSKKSRLVKAFEEHCIGSVSDSKIPGMAAPISDGH